MAKQITAMQMVKNHLELKGKVWNVYNKTAYEAFCKHGEDSEIFKSCEHELKRVQHEIDWLESLLEQMENEANNA